MSNEQDKVRFDLLPAYAIRNPSLSIPIEPENKKLTLRDKMHLAAQVMVPILALAGITYVEPQIGLMFLGAISGMLIVMRLY